MRKRLKNVQLAKDVKRSTQTQQPTIPWPSLLRQRPRQCSTLQRTQLGWGNYQELSCSLTLVLHRLKRRTKAEAVDDVLKTDKERCALEHGLRVPCRVNPKRWNSESKLAQVLEQSEFNLSGLTRAAGLTYIEKILNIYTQIKRVPPGRRAVPWLCWRMRWRRSA